LSEVVEIDEFAGFSLLYVRKFQKYRRH